MLRRRKRHGPDTGTIAKLWGFNLLMAAMLVSTYFGLPFLKSSVLEYRDVPADPFDGTVSPIAYVPNWLEAKFWNKSLRFEDISSDSFVEIPRYDPQILRNDDAKNRVAVMERATYVTPYMGSYRMNFEEYDGSHLGVDIRAPLGTPVLSVANGVVVKVNDKETADGKYVVVRHDSVPTPSGTMNLYSSYLHLEAVAVEPGTKIRKGQPLGRVGMTGITTTPHLHFQVDKETAPFHVYWPYSFSDIRDIGIDFFAAVNMGLGKENAIKYTVHPMDFVQNNLFAASAPVRDVAIAANASAEPSESAPKNSAPPEKTVAAPVVDVPKASELPVSAPVETPTVSAPTVPTPVFSDVARSAAYKPALDRLVSAGLFDSLKAEKFRPFEPMTRRDAAIVLASALGLSPAEFPELPFSDVLPSDASAGILSPLLERGVVGSAANFRPNAAITRAEAAILLTRASGIAPVSGRSAFRDVRANDPRAATLNAFAATLGLKKNAKFLPDSPLSRAEFVKLVDNWRERTGKLK